MTAIGAVLWWTLRRLAFSWRKWRFFKAEGASPDKPIAVKTFQAPRRKVRTISCYCGGRLWDVGEGPSKQAGGFRVVAECEKCQRGCAFYFDVSEVPN